MLHATCYYMQYLRPVDGPEGRFYVEYSRDAIPDLKAFMITQYEIRPMPKDRAHFLKDEYGRKRPILRYYGLFDKQSRPKRLV